MPFTPEQVKAIKDQGRDILVSASAGSGKTTVLVERVLHEILHGRSIDQLLIVTFTKAAAEEMKERIKNRLNKEAQANPRQRHYLEEQLRQIDTANISTIDAFCLQVIHRFYYAIDLDPSFSVLTDETQAELLKEQALKEVEKQKLTSHDQSFIAFYNNFAGDRDADSPRTLLLDLYDYALAKPDYVSWLRNLPADYEFKGEITQSPIWQKGIKPYLTTTFGDLQAKITHLLATVTFQDPNLSKARKAFQEFAHKLAQFLAALAKDQPYDALRQKLRACQFTVTFKKSKKWKQDLLTFYDHLQSTKAQAKKQVLTVFTAFFASKELPQKQALAKGKEIVQAIAEAEEALIVHFGALKREQNLIDYSDMEQMAYQILSQDTSDSQLARDFYQNKFKEILVDEYQDINPLQERIIQLLKKEDKNHLFMVGDVKQSIYGFRQAEPSLFLHKYQEFGQAPNKERILLSANFRSTKPVTKTVNHLFKPILSKDFGGIDYQREAQLVFGAKYYPAELPKATEVIYHPRGQKGESKNETAADDFKEIQMVIERIKQFKKEGFQVYDSHIQAKRPLHYRDIAILTRSRTNNLQIMQEFAKNQLPLFVTDAENYFQTFELTVIMNYLKIIDNPDQDIPLVTVLRSPIFNFKEKDLAKIRIHSRNTSFYNALLSYVNFHNDLSGRIKSFLNKLTALRDFSTTHRISELIWSIYERTSLLEIMTAMPNGEQRRINLEALYERASSYESAGFKGLYQFINFIERMRRSQKDLAQPLLTKEAGDAVRLMTIHGAKGLEFPVVFLVGLEHHYQMRDLKGDYVIQKNSLGLTIRQKHYRLDTLVKALADVHKKRQLLEEEARILYVALTRAKQKLILVADIPHFDKKVTTWQRQLNECHQISLTDKLAATSPLSFLGPSLQFDRQVPEKMTAISSGVDQKAGLIFVSCPAEANKETVNKAQTLKSDQNQLLTTTAEKLFSFVYPFQDASKTTAYQAVSEIKKAFNDPLDTDLANARLIKSSNRYLAPIDVKPNFLFANKFSGAEIGTATHLLLQYYDYSGQYNEQILRKEIKQLIKQNKLNANIVPSIKLKNITWFVQSKFAHPFWLHPARLHREVDFSSLLTAGKLFPHFSDPEAKILVHGTIDGYYQGQEGIVLFDYKTDHVDASQMKLSIKKMKAKYAGQLRLYAKALSEFSHQKILAKYLILLDGQKVVKVD